MVESGAGDGGPETSLEDALAALKRSGSVSLVVGSVPPAAYRRVSERMLGDPRAGAERRRLLVAPENDRESALERLRATGRTDPSHARAVTLDDTSRSAAAAGDGGGQATPVVTRVDGSIVDLGGAITDVIERFDVVAGGLAPAELRVGVDALAALNGYDTRTAFGFLHLLGTQVRSVDGMGHVRLARDVDSVAARTLAPLFDAVVELRLDGYRLEQRWHVEREGVVSDWLPVDGPGDGR